MALTKADYISALTDAGVTLAGNEKLTDLQALAQGHNVTIGQKAVDGNRATVLDQHGNTVRVYDRETHGDTFLEHANEKAEQVPGSTVNVE